SDTEGLLQAGDFDKEALARVEADLRRRFSESIPSLLRRPSKWDKRPECPVLLRKPGEPAVIGMIDAHLPPGFSYRVVAVLVNAWYKQPEGLTLAELRAAVGEGDDGGPIDVSQVLRDLCRKGPSYDLWSKVIVRPGKHTAGSREGRFRIQPLP